jgi:KamA family protein
LFERDLTGIPSAAAGREVPTSERYRAWGPPHLDRLAARYPLPVDEVDTIRLHALVLPFRVNEYVLDHLIDWSAVPDDPVYQLVFPQPGMLSAADETTLRATLHDGSPTPHTAEVVQRLRESLNPHPAGQRELNVPTVAGQPLAGVQHKYAETVLYFPSQGQTCHAYCTYCFRWAQFVGDQELQFGTPDPRGLVAYLREHPEVSDVLVTGGDPMIMTTGRLRDHVEPLLDVPTVQTIRLGTKALAYWPQRFVTDRDADDALHLVEQVVASGRTLAVMAHMSHVRELSTSLAQQALARLRAAGAVVYCQSPVMAHVNDSADDWHALWRAEISAGAVPYYMFMPRDTGPREYFEVPLARAVEIFADAYRRLPGLARTVRGPVMSTTPGKVVVDGVTGEGSQRAFQLRFLQARDPGLVGRPFAAAYSDTAAWLDALALDPATPGDLANACGVRAWSPAEPSPATA